jgi:hypothetical protein
MQADAYAGFGKLYKANRKASPIIEARDDRAFAGPDPPAAVFFYSQDRSGERIPSNIWRAIPG